MNKIEYYFWITVGFVGRKNDSFYEFLWTLWNYYIKRNHDYYQGKCWICGKKQ